MPAILRAQPDVSYVVVGEGADQERLRRVALECGVDSRVLFVGRVSDAVLAALYGRCEAFVLPVKEGSGSCS